MTTTIINYNNYYYHTTCECGSVVIVVSRNRLNVCLSVCRSVVDPRKFIFGLQVHLQNVWVKLVYRGHRVKVKVTGTKKRVSVSGNSRGGVCLRLIGSLVNLMLKSGEIYSMAKIHDSRNLALGLAL